MKAWLKGGLVGILLIIATTLIVTAQEVQEIILPESPPEPSWYERMPFFYIFLISTLALVIIVLLVYFLCKKTNFKPWLKGGISGVIFQTVKFAVSIYLGSIWQGIPLYTEFGLIFILGQFVKPVPHIGLYTLLIFNLLFWFLVGALIGLIYSKLKKKGGKIERSI